MAIQVSVENQAKLAPEAFDPIRRAVEQHATMERALAWFFAQVPPLGCALVTQVP